MSIPLTRNDLSDACNALGCTEAVLKAVIEVEAAGKGFDDKGRPTILFEPHVYERELNRLGYPDGGEHVMWARRQRIASPIWDRKLYGRSADDRWKQVEIASRLDAGAALRATSFGLPQIMGFNHRQTGFERVGDFVDFMSVSEGNQITAMVRFIQRMALDDELQALDWTAFARGYNGPSFQLNDYDGKLARAYDKHRQDPSAFWREKPGGGWGPAAGQEHLVEATVEMGPHA